MAIISISLDDDTLRKLDALAGPRGRSALLGGMTRAAFDAVVEHHKENARFRRRGAPPLPFDLQDPRAPVLRIQAVYHPREPQPVAALPESYFRRKASTPRGKRA